MKSQFDDDEDELSQEEEFMERLTDEGEILLGCKWDAEDEDETSWDIYELDQQFYIWVSNADPDGPYETIHDCLEAYDEYLTVGHPHTTFRSKDIPTKEVAAFLKCDEEHGFEIKINNEPWVWSEPGVFKRKTTSKKK